MAVVRVADYIARFLADRGVKDIFMLTGNGAMYLNDAIAQADVRYVCARNEAAAPMMAEAYARVKQTLGAVCVTSGPGSTNAVPGLAEAWVDAAPIFVVSGQVERCHTTHNLGLPGVRTFGTAEIDIVPIVRPLTKYAALVNDPDTIRFHLEKAAHLATSGRPGPVWLDVPMDVQYATVDPERLPGYTPPPDPLAAIDLTPSVDAVVELLRTAKRPLLIGGHGVRQAGAVEELRGLIDESRTPVILSRLGQDMLPWSHPLNFGQAGLKGSKYCGFIMRSADLVIALGCRLAVQLVGHRFDAFSPRAKVVAVDIEADELKKPGVRIDVPVLADVRTFLPRLRKALAGARLPDRQAWIDYCADVKQRYPMITPDRQRTPIDLYYFMHRLDAVSGPRHLFVTDAGSNYYVGGQVYRFEHGQREVTSGTFAAMGLSIPLAIGAAIAAPDAQVLAVTGDGSLELNIQELKTLSYYGLDVKLFVINNGGYLSMRNWQDGYFEGRRIGSDAATGAESLDLPKIAEAFDLPYTRIARHEEIDDRLREILRERGPRFVEVVCDDRQEIAGPLKEGWAPAGGDE